MLTVIENLSHIRFSELMEIYADANKENGAALFPKLSEYMQIQEAEQDFYRYLKYVFFEQPGACYCIWEVQNRYCSALRLEPFLDGLLLCALETSPLRRGKGYATALVRSVQNYLSSFGEVIIYSHVSKRNKASLALHQKCGFSVIENYAVYSDGSVMQNSYTLKFTCKKSESSV